MTTILVVLLVVVALLAAGGVALAVSSRRTFQRDNELIPGTPTSAPAAWAGSHTPEAKLHRRLRDVVRSTRALGLPDDVALLDLRVSLEQQAVAIDERLIAAAALPAPVRTEPLARLSAAVDAIEAAAAQLALLDGDGTQRIEDTTAEVARRIANAAELRAAVEAEAGPTASAPPTAEEGGTA